MQANALVRAKSARSTGSHADTPIFEEYVLIISERPKDRRSRSAPSAPKTSATLRVLRCGKACRRSRFSAKARMAAKCHHAGKFLQPAGKASRERRATKVETSTSQADGRPDVAATKPRRGHKKKQVLCRRDILPDGKC